MKYNIFCALAFSSMLIGCASNQKAIEDLYKKQDQLEIKIDQMYLDIETIRADLKESTKDIELRVKESYSKRIEQTYKDLEKRIQDLEKKKTTARSQYVEPPDAQYAIAETYYTKREFREAILSFQRFIATYPNDRRVPLCYLKQGISLINIGKKEEAKFFFQTLIDKFPKSNEAEIAKDKLREIDQNS